MLMCKFPFTFQMRRNNSNSPLFERRRRHKCVAALGAAVRLSGYTYCYVFIAVQEQITVDRLI